MRYLIILCLITCVSDNYAQYMDTLYLENSAYKYSVTVPLKPGNGRTRVSYYDENDRLKQRTEFKNGKMHGKALYYYDEGGTTW